MHNKMPFIEYIDKNMHNKTPFVGHVIQNMCDKRPFVGYIKITGLNEIIHK